MENQDDQFTAEDVLSVSGEYGVVNQIEFKGRSFAGVSLKHYRILRKNQVVYTKSPLKLAPLGIVKANLFQDGIVSALYGVYDVIDADPSFVQYHFESIPRLNNYLRPLVNKGAKNTLLISDEDAVSGEVYFPAVREQREIGLLFQSLDALIAGREKALEKLEALKKSMLLKMFPQGDATVPEVRFKGFAGDWEKKRLVDVFHERESRSKEGVLLSVSMNSGVFPASENGRYDNSSIENGNYECVVKGDIAYNSMRMWQGACGASALCGLVSPAYTVVVPDENTDSVFYEYAFKTSQMLHSFRKHSQGLTSDTWNLKFPLFAEIEVRSPCHPEQQKIGAYFRSLDALLAARREEVGKLKQMKKALLERMFV